MSLRLGSNSEPNNMYYGSDPVNRMYVGSQQVWPAASTGSVWEGSPGAQTLTVQVEEIFPGGRNFSPLPVEFRIRVSGSPVGDTPDTAVGTQSGTDGKRGQALSLDLSEGFQAKDRTFSQLHYVVHTGDSGQYRNTRLGHASHGDKAFQYGQNPGHVYSNPGTYTGRAVYVYDNAGNWGVAQLPDLLVEDPDTSFRQEDVIVVSNDPNEDWSEAPPHLPENRVTSIDAATTKFFDMRLVTNDLPDGHGVRVSVKPGTTYNEVAQLPDFGFMNGRALFDTWDHTGTCTYDETGITAPYSQSLFTASGTDQWPFAIKGWKFNFGYDVNSGRPSGIAWEDFSGRGLWRGDDQRFVTYGGAPGIPAVRGLRLCFDNVDVEGCQSAVFSTGSPEFCSRYSAWFFNDCLFQRNNDYVSFQGSNIFHLGTQGLEEYGTDLGAMGRARIGGPQRGYRGHRNIRETTMWVVYMRACYWESRGGWSGQNDGDTLYAPQPGMRFYEGSNNHQRFGKRYYICDSVMMCPFNVDLGAIDETDRAGVHAVVENCILMNDPANSQTSILDGLGGLKTVRNCQLVCLDTPAIENAADPELNGKDLSRFEVNIGQVRIGRFTHFLGVLYQPRNFNEDLEILHNTFVVLRSDSDIEGSFATITPTVEDRSNNDADTPIANFYNVVDGHNITYAPNLSSPMGPTMATSNLPAGVRVLDVWMRTMWERQTFTLPAAVANGETTPEIPYPVDWYGNPTNQTSYAGSSGLHSVRLASNNNDLAQTSFAPNFPPEEKDAITVNFGATGFTITNRSSQTWSGGITIILDRGSTAMAADRLHDVDQTAIKLYRPASAQSLDAGVRSTLFDFARQLRPNAGYAISPSAGSNVAGSLLA